VNAQEPSQPLVDRASRGDAAAVEDLLSLHLPGLTKFLRHHAGAAVLARESPDDRVQSVCRKVLKRLRDGRFLWRGEGAFNQWLDQAAVLKLRDRRDIHGAEKRDARQEAAMPSGSNVPLAAPWLRGAEPSPSEDAALHEQVAPLARTLDRLSDSHRQVIELAHFEGLSHAEIGARLCISEAASRQLLARALARLTTLQAESLPPDAGRV